MASFSELANLSADVVAKVEDSWPAAGAAIATAKPGRIAVATADARQISRSTTTPERVAE